MTAHRFGILEGGRDDAHEAVDKRRRGRIHSLCQRAHASAKSAGAAAQVSVVLLAEGNAQPSAVWQVLDSTDAAALAVEVDETIADDTAFSRATSYRLLVQSGPETVGTLAVRVRTESRHTLDGHLRGPAESAEGAVVRQLMRHNEEQARVFLGMLERITAVDEKRQARTLERLERLEAERAEVERASVERMRLELELAKDASRADLQDKAIRQLLPLLAPATARLVGAATRALAPDAGQAPKAPAQQAAPVKATPGPEIKGGAAVELAHSAPEGEDGARLLEIVRTLDPEAVDALGGWLEATGRESDAAQLRRIAAKKDAP